ncbi:hypothetical protein GCK72_013201 [Caenorhabditis remanei]|uniref:Serpentine receptor class r-10 n=1 Tax=Caenorhabditis remanei TaxID=31234 RepID=A0A6A5GN64_CAERE|nr:hypothetical protein GCK72_013201 [Caenorhabditis remanei]KAF1756747.1 hypothetical protein GCK72_013201 [Caenorhabditis remanei]
MIYSIVDFLVQPYIHSHGAAYGMYMDLRGSVFESYPRVAFTLTALLCGCFAATIYAISINFIYRFLALERKGRLRFFSNYRLIFWGCIPITVAFLIILNIWFFNYPNQEVIEYTRNNLKELYDLDADRMAYVGCLYWRTDSNGNVYFSVKDLIGSLNLNALMTLALFIIFYFGTKSYWKIKELISQGQSEYSKRLQMQLYKALVAQTLIPMVFLFLPISSKVYCPLIGINVEWNSLLVTFLYSFYPAVDPIPIIILVDDYRNAFCNFFRRVLSKNQVVSVVSIDLNTDPL